MSDNKLSNKLCFLIEYWDDESNIKQVEALIEKGADVNFQNEVWDFSTPLHLAVAKNSLNVIKLLLNRGADRNLRNSDDKTAADIAHEIKKQEILVLLSSVEMEAMVISAEDETYSSLHESILNGSLETVGECIKLMKVDNFDIKHGFDDNQNSALKVALLNMKFDIYAFLQSKNFILGCNESFEELKAEVLEKDSKAMAKLRQENLRFLHNSQVFQLVSKTQIRPILSVKDELSKFDVIRSWFEELFAIPILAVILQIISKAKNVKIVVDFNCIRDVDPSLSGKTLGTTYFEEKNIIIDGNRERYDILGTMIHEFVHLVMFLVYQNDGRPYHEHDLESREKLEEIVQKFIDPELHSIEKIISRVYGYSADKRHQEIIVRPAQILAQYNLSPEKIDELKVCFSDIFTFFEDKTIPDCESFNSNLETTEATRDLNKTLNVIGLIEAFKLECTGKTVGTAENVDGFKVVKSNVPLLAMKTIFNQLYDTQGEQALSLNLFMHFSSLTNSKNAEIIRIVGTGRTKPLVFIFYESTKAPQINRNVFKLLESLHTMKFVVTFIFHFSIDDSKIFGNFSYQISDEVTFQWKDLEMASKRKALRSEIHFQKRVLAFNEVITPQTPFLQEERLNTVLDTKDIFDIVDQKNEISCLETSFFIPRTFILENKNDSGGNKQYGDTDILGFSEEQGTVILADVAGEQSFRYSTVHKTLSLLFRHGKNFCIAALQRTT
jgi:hypothetical protein